MLGLHVLYFAICHLCVCLCVWLCFGLSPFEFFPQETVFQCLQSWVRHVDVPGDELAGNPLLPAAFDALKNVELFETAVDLLVEVRKQGVSKVFTVLCIGNRGVFLLGLSYLEIVFIRYVFCSSCEM